MSQEKLLIDFCPSEYSVFGGESILITVCGHQTLPDWATSLFVVFEGTEQRHVSAAHRINGNTLQAAIPGHDRAEEVTLRMGYENAEGFFTLASGTFTYRLDPTHCIAQFLADSVKCTNRLHSLSHIDFTSLGTNSEATAVFDEKLTHSFQRLAFPSDWTLCRSGEEEQESLLHFSARLGLSQFTDYLLKLPGGKTAALMKNKDGEKPLDVSKRMGHVQVTSQLIRQLEEMKEEDDSKQGETKGRTPALDEDRLLLEELNDIMNTQSQRRMSTSAIPSIPNRDLGVLHEEETALQAAPDGVVYRQRRHQPVMRPFSCQVESVFTDETGTVLLDLGKQRQKHVSADYETEEKDDTTGVVRRRKRSQSAGPTPAPSVHSLEESLVRLKKFKQELEHLKEKNLQLIKAVELGQFSASCPSLAEESALQALKQPRPIPNLCLALSSGSTPDLLTHLSPEKVDRSLLEQTATSMYHRDSVSDRESSLSSQDDETSESRRGSSVDINEEENETVESVVSDLLEQIVNRVVVNVETETVFDDDATSDVEDVDSVVTAIVSVMVDRVAEILSGQVVRLSTLTSSNVDDVDINDLDEILENRNWKAHVAKEVDAMMTGGSLHIPTSSSLNGGVVNDNEHVVSTPHPSKDEGSCDGEGDEEAVDGVVYKRSRALSVGSGIGVPAALQLGDAVSGEGTSGTNEEHDSLSRKGHRKTHSLSSPIIDIASVGLEFESNSRTQLDALNGTDETVDVERLSHDGSGVDGDNEEEVGIQVVDGSISKAILLARQSILSGPASPAERDFLKGIRQGLDEPDDELVMPRNRMSASTLDFNGDDRRPSLVNTLKVEDETGVLKSSSSPEVRVNPQLDKRPDRERASSPFTRDHNRAFHSIVKKLPGGRERPMSFHVPFTFGYSDVFPPCAEENQESASDNESTHTISEAQGDAMEMKQDDIQGPKRRFTSFLRRRDKDKPKAALMRKGSKLSVEGERDRHRHGRPDDDHLLLRRQTVSIGGDHSSNVTMARMSTFSTGSPTSKTRKYTDKRLHLSRSTIIPKVDPSVPGSGSLVHSKHVSKSQGSLDSLLSHDDDDRESLSDLVNDPELALIDEPDNWQSVVDKKVVKKLGKKEVMRQERIYELILTERRHVRTVKVMMLLFGRGMIHRARLQTEVVDEMMPGIENLDQISTSFCGELMRRQGESSGFVVGHIGDILVKQFTGDLGDEMKIAYSTFCSRHLEAVEKCKELHRTNKAFRNFMNKCTANPLCRRLDFAGHVLLITQRLGKYNALLEGLLKSTKDSKETGKEEYRNIQVAWKGVKEISECVDRAVKNRQQRLRLQALQSRLEVRIQVKAHKSVRKVKNLNLLANSSRLLYENGDVVWKGSGESTIDVHVVLTTRLLVLLVEKDNEKFNIAMLQDKKPPVISLNHLMQRSNAADLRALYLISTGRNPEMYPLFWSSKHDRDVFLQALKPAIENFSRAVGTDEPDGILSSDSEDERRKQDDAKSVASGGSLGSPPPVYESEGESVSDSLNVIPLINEEMREKMEEQRQKVNELMRQLQSKDSDLDTVLKDKANLIAEIRSLTGDSGDSDSVDSSREMFVSAARQLTDQISLSFETSLTGGDLVVCHHSQVAGGFQRDSFSSVHSQASSSDVEAAVERSRAQTVATPGYKSASVEPDPQHGRRAASSVRMTRRSGQEGQIDLLCLPMLVREKRRPASQSSADRMEDKMDKVVSPRRTSAPDSPIRSANKAHLPLPAVPAEGEGVDSEGVVSEEGNREDMNTLVRLAHTVDTILGKMAEQATEIERLRAELHSLKPERSSYKATSSQPSDERPTVTRPAGAPLIQEMALRRTPSGASSLSTASPNQSPRGSPRSQSPALETGGRLRKFSKKKDAKSPLQTNADLP